jgi:hypothetical protein
MAKFVIEANGKVSSSVATGLPKVDTCVADVIKQIVFPAIAKRTLIDYPFDFKNATADAPPPPDEKMSGGDIDKAVIRRVIKRHIDEIQYCYEKFLLEKPTLAGTVMARFTIAPDGSVAASVASGIPDVADCVAGVIKRAQFPKSQSGKPTEVNYPFTFHGAGN